MKRVLTLLTATLPLHAQDTPPLLGDHLEPSTALAREHVHHARIAGTVVDGSGKPVAMARVVVYGLQPYYQALPLGSATADEHGAWSCDVQGQGRTRLWVASPPDRPFAVADGPLTLCSGRSERMRPVVLEIPAGEATATTTVRGRVLAADGTAIAGAFVRLVHGQRFDPTAFTATDTAGAFAIATGLGAPVGATVLFGSYRIEIEHASGTDTLRREGANWQLDLGKEMLVQSADFVAHPLAAAGASSVRYATFRGGVATPCLVPVVHGIRSDWSSGSSYVVASTAGHLPQLRSVPDKQFDFRGGKPRTLRVVDDAGKPIAEALVDLCTDGTRFEEWTLATERTDRDGTLTLDADEDDRCVVYAYADGHDPARGVWTADRELRLVLPRRSGSLHVQMPEGARSLFVRRAGLFDPAAIRYDAGELTIDLTPGDYEVTCYGEQKPLLAMEVVTVTANQRTVPLLKTDQRPTVRLRVPPAAAGSDEWWAYASRETLGGMITKFAVYTDRGGPMPRRALVAEVEKVVTAAGGGLEFLLRVPISGRQTLLLGAEKRATRWFREVVLAAGGTYTLTLPGSAVDVAGKVKEYPEMWSGSPIHGVVGPRLCLEPERETPFGLLVPLPEPATFQVKVPVPGTYTVHHHLYETGILFSDNGVSGGAPLTLAAGGAGDLGELQRGEGAELTVQVVDAEQRPLLGHLAVRDRMFEAWTHDLQQNTTLDDAADPIPTPPNGRLVDGTAKLPRIRKGRVQFVAELDGGGRVFFTRDVDPAQPLVVRLPFPVR